MGRAEEGGGEGSKEVWGVYLGGGGEWGGVG